MQNHVDGKMTVNRQSPVIAGRTGSQRKLGTNSKEVPLQVMVPAAVRKQVALMSIERGENLRTLVLRALKGLGITVPESELVDRRGRKPRE